MDSLYADPDRKVPCNCELSILFCSKTELISSFWNFRHMMFWACIMVFDGHFSTQLVYFSQPLSRFARYFTCFYSMLYIYFLLHKIVQTKVFSRFEDLKRAMKNYTIKATPTDTSSVLQQVLKYAPTFMR